MRFLALLALASTCFAQSSALKQYLSLTAAQATAIANLNSAYQSNLSPKLQRAQTLNQELANLYATPAPDPNELGLRYAELESIRRAQAAQLATFQTQLTAQFTPAQAVSIQNLNAASEAQPLINEAQCGFLLDSSPSQWFDTASLNLNGALYYPGTILPPAPTGNFCGAILYPAAIRQYLNLTDAQIAAIFNISAAYNDYSARKQNRLSDLYVEIRDETAKPAPNPAALGVRYAEVVTINQDIQNQNTQSRQTARALLSAPQTAQLKTLQNDATLQPLISEAENLNLLLPPPASTSNASFPDPLPPLPLPTLPASRLVTLAQYLNLTDQQLAALRKLNTDYQTYLNPQQQRINTISYELSVLYSAASPDPNQLGVRYVELELIRRDVATHLSTLQAQLAAQLTKAQLPSIQALNSAAVLQPLINDAQCGFLVDPSPFGFVSFLLGALTTVPTSAQRSGDFSVITQLPVTYPYIPPAPTANFCGSTTYPISVREYLNLADSQVATIFLQSAAYNDYYARKQNRIADVTVELRDETAKPVPSPLALGLRYAEINGIGQEISASGTQLRQAARAALSPQQSAQIKTLQDDADLQPLVSQAQSCNLLVLAPGTGSNFTPVFGFVLVTSLNPVAFFGSFCGL